MCEHTQKLNSGETQVKLRLHPTPSRRRCSQLLGRSASRRGQCSWLRNHKMANGYMSLCTRGCVASCSYVFAMKAWPELSPRTRRRCPRFRKVKGSKAIAQLIQCNLSLLDGGREMFGRSKYFKEGVLLIATDASMGKVPMEAFALKKVPTCPLPHGGRCHLLNMLIRSNDVRLESKAWPPRTRRHCPRTSSRLKAQQLSPVFNDSCLNM